jgi:hypothetical protein
MNEARESTRASRLLQKLHQNGLSLALLALFLITFVGQMAAGMFEYNDELRERGQATLSLWPYLNSGHFIEATGASWASEFLQIAIFVLLSARLVQKGSPEGLSDDDDDDDEDDDEEAARNDPRAPWPVRKGGVILWLYSHSLSLVSAVLFIVCFVLHAFGGARAQTVEQLEQGGEPVGTLEFLGTSRFWFQTMQNWQSGFFSLAVMVFFLVYLRERGSVVSKRVAAPHDADE